MACLPASGSAFAKGTTAVTCTATDSSGNTASCAFNVTVNDTEKPLLGACPQDLTQNTDPAKCTAVVAYSPPGATDNCPGVSVACLPASGSAFAKGTTARYRGAIQSRTCP